MGAGKMPNMKAPTEENSDNEKVEKDCLARGDRGGRSLGVPWDSSEATLQASCHFRGTGPTPRQGLGPRL